MVYRWPTLKPACGDLGEFESAQQAARSKTSKEKPIRTGAPAAATSGCCSAQAGASPSWGFTRTR